MDELAVNNLNEDREGPRIFKILANCMTSNKHEQPKKETKQIDPNAKFLKVLIEDFKFSQEDANEALIHTNNDSIDEAVAYITIKYAKD
jgi:NACalpha-BTF3-like transcription factor